MSDLIYIDKIMHNGSGVTKLFHNESIVKKLYHGDDLLFRALGGKPYLILSETQLGLNVTGETQTVTVASSNPYTATTTSDWITLEQNGQTLSITASATQSDRNGTITVSTTNGYFSINETISISQKNVEFVDYVYTSSEAYVDTTIRPTTNTKFTVKLKQTGIQGGATVGYFMSNTPITCENDSTDYRCFNYNGMNSFYWDFNGSRIRGNISPESDGLIIATFGNNYIADKNGNKVATGSTQSSIATQRNVPIYINLDNRYAQIQQVTIYDNDVVVFDGYAADDDGDYGIYDTVSETLLKPTNGATVYKGTW